MFDAFPWFIAIAIGPVLLAIAFIWALNRRKKRRTGPELAADHPARGGGDVDRVKTP